MQMDGAVNPLPALGRICSIKILLTNLVYFLITNSSPTLRSVSKLNITACTLSSDIRLR